MLNFRKPLAVATVTTSSFIPGTLVLLHSFLNSNPWFKGDILIFHDQLPDTFKELLQRLHPIRFFQIKKDLLQRIHTLIPEYSDFERRKAQFYSLDVFEITEYDKLLFLDSDMLIRGSLQEICERKEPFLACGTVGYYKPDNNKNNPFQVEKFNAGFMCIHRTMLGKSVRNELLNRVSIEFFTPFFQWAENHQLPRVGTDQIILNTQFGDHATIVSAEYNYRTGIAHEILMHDNCRMENAKIIHFTGGKKPWMPVKLLEHLFRQSNGLPIFSLWTETWLTLLQSLEQMPKK